MIGASVPSMIGASVPSMIAASMPPMIAASVPPMIGASVPPMIGASVPPMIGVGNPQIMRKSDAGHGASSPRRLHAHDDGVGRLVVQPAPVPVGDQWRHHGQQQQRAHQAPAEADRPPVQPGDPQAE